MEEKYLTKYFAAIYRKSKHEFNNLFERKNGLKATQGDILMFLYEHPHFQQKDIAEQMAIDTSLMVRNLNALEQLGLVVRSKEGDLRANYVQLTAKGEALALEISGNMERWWREFFEELPEVDLPRLTQFLYQTYEKMRQLE